MRPADSEKFSPTEMVVCALTLERSSAAAAPVFLPNPQCEMRHRGRQVVWYASPMLSEAEARKAPARPEPTRGGVHDGRSRALVSEAITLCQQHAGRETRCGRPPDRTSSGAARRVFDASALGVAGRSPRSR